MPVPGLMAVVDVRAAAEGGYTLEVMRADGPEQDKMGYCSPPRYAFDEDAQLIELPPGTYGLMAKAERLSIPDAFPVEGAVTVAAGACYTPAMVCRGRAPDAGVCRLTLTPKRCPAVDSARRVVVNGIANC